MMMQPLIMAVLVDQHRTDLTRRAEHARAVQAARGDRSRGNQGGRRGRQARAASAGPVDRRRRGRVREQVA
jgi:hypothetical protein